MLRVPTSLSESCGGFCCQAERLYSTRASAADVRDTIARAAQGSRRTDSAPYPATGWFHVRDDDGDLVLSRVLRANTIYYPKVRLVFESEDESGGCQIRIQYVMPVWYRLAAEVSIACAVLLGIVMLIVSSEAPKEARLESIALSLVPITLVRVLCKLFWRGVAFEEREFIRRAKATRVG